MIRDDQGRLPTPPVWVDFMARDNASRVPLDYPGTQADLARHRIELREGMSITLYTHDATDATGPDDLVTVGVVHLDPGLRRWFAKFDWTALVHVSELDELDRRLYQSAKS